MNGVLQEFTSTLVGGITSIASGIGSGVNQYVEDLFFKMNGDVVDGLSTFGGTVAIFGGVALAVGLTTLIFNWIRSIGNN